jgi:hypothetical protein
MLCVALGITSLLLAAPSVVALDHICDSAADPTCSPADSGLSLLQKRALKVPHPHAVKSWRIAHWLAQAAKAGDLSDTTKSLFESFQICGQCSNFQRFGEAHDGGYLMCMDGLKKGSVKAAYSLGVEHHDKWSQDVVKHLGVAVHQFDCTVKGSDCKGCRFYKKCIVSADGKHPVLGHESEGWGLNQALAETLQASAADGSLLMKMDIESSEWPIYAAERPEVLRKFGELIVEFHELQEEKRHQEYLQAMRHILAAGFKVAHLHGNNNQGMYKSGSLSIPEVLEVTFVHGAMRPNGCSADQIYEKLDAANIPQNGAELPMAHLADKVRAS